MRPQSLALPFCPAGKEHSQAGDMRLFPAPGLPPVPFSHRLSSFVEYSVVSVFCLWFSTDTTNAAFDTKRNTSLDVPESRGPDGLETPRAALRSGIQPRSRLILQAPLNVHWAQATSQRALSASDLPVTAESRERGPADGAVKYRLHRGSDFFTGPNERQLRAGLQPSDPRVSRAVELSSLCP